MALGSYREGLVLVGGWVPYLLLKAYQSQDIPFQHVGSKDIDIVVNPAIVDQKQYLFFDRILNEEVYQFHQIFPDGPFCLAPSCGSIGTWWRKR